MIMALTIAVLVTGAVYLILQRGMVRIVFGMSLFGHASNLTLLATGVGAWRGEAFPSRTSIDDMSDPLPQAFVLTAIVIAMATTTILLMLAALGKNDDTYDSKSDSAQAPGAQVTDNIGANYAPEFDPDAGEVPPSELSTPGRTAHKSLKNTPAKPGKEA